MAPSDYRLFDADNHFFEPSDCFTGYIDPKLRHKAIRLEPQADGSDRIMVGDRPMTYYETIPGLEKPLPPEVAGLTKPFRGWTVNRPGVLRERLRRMKSGVAHEDIQQFMQPAYMKRDARLAVMDEQGIESTFLFPSLGVCVEHFMKDDPEQLYANLHAFNLWMLGEWGFEHEGRIYTPPLISLLDRDRAVAELEWAIAQGARLIGMRPGPAHGRSPADPHFDPFWALANEAKLTVAFHSAESGYNELYSVHWGEEANPKSHHQSAFQWICFFGDRPIMETIVSMIHMNLFGRFPNLKVASIENGSLWVPYLLKAMDKMKGMGRNGPWPGGYVSGRFSEVFKQHVFVSPHHHGEDIPALVELIGPTQVMMGSDYPHAECLAEPREFADRLEGLPEDQKRMVLRDNARGLVGAD